jgi:hypothetical protein
MFILCLFLPTLKRGLLEKTLEISNTNTLIMRIINFPGKKKFERLNMGFTSYGFLLILILLYKLEFLSKPFVGFLGNFFSKQRLALSIF